MRKINRRSFLKATAVAGTFALLAGCSGSSSSTQTTVESKPEPTVAPEPTTPIAVKPASSLPRTVITTDGEVDDMNSVIRALLYASEMDIAGIVITSSTYHYAGDAEAGIAPFRWTGTEWIWNFLDAYETVRPNLIKHDPNYPTADYLRSVTRIGNITNVGEMEKITEGSEFLKELFLDNDERTLYVQTWGGTNTTARALKSIEEEYASTDKWEEIKAKINKKLVVYIILDQDASYADYIAKNWPDLTIINDRSNFWHFAYAWQYHDDSVNACLHADWMQENMLNKGALMDYYALMGDGKWIEGEDDNEQRGPDAYLEANPSYQRYDFISEGDSPSFLYLVDNGLRNTENPSFGGWGGRFGKVSDTRSINNVVDFNPATNRFEGEYSLMRWFDDMQNDFAARADWCIADSYAKANHAPIVSVKEGVDISAAAGENVTLTADAYDPDGDEITYKWWRYFEADTYQDEKREVPTIYEDTSIGMLLYVNRELIEGEVLDSIVLNGADTAQVSFTVPDDAKNGDTIHIILEVQDNGKHALKHYQRVIVTVK